MWVKLWAFIKLQKSILMNISFIINSGYKITDYSIPQTITFRYRIGRNLDLKRSTGFKVLVNKSNKTKSDWDEEKQRVKNKSSIINRVQINRLLDRLEAYFKAFHDENTSKGVIPSKEEVKMHYKAFFDNRIETSTNDNLIKYIKEYIERPSVKLGRSSGTLRNYEKVKNILIQFEKEEYPLSFDKITLNWYNDFIEWFTNKGYSLNYTGDVIKNVKMFLRNAFEDKVSNNDIFRNSKFKALKEESEDIYLTQEEVEKLYNLNLETLKGLDLIRDLFLIGCYTGLRVSDYNSITSDNLIERNGVKFLEVLPTKTKKSGKSIVIPLRLECLNILEKYSFNPPRRAEAYINRKIKDIAEFAEINEEIELSIPDGKNRKLIKEKKFNLVKSHTARRSFCTNAYLSGMSSLDIMQISGHKTESSFLKYIKITPSETAERLADSSFFQGGNLKVV